MKRKLLSLVLSAALVLSMAACGNEDEPANGSTPQDSTSLSSEPESSSAGEPSDEGDASDASDVGGAASGEPTVIRFGTHWVPELDPYYTDEVTGEYTMGERERQAALAGLEAIKKAYNVEFEFLQYPVDVASDLMTSVLAQDPICDLALMWGGVEPTILAQNVLQDLSAYTGLFEDDEASWLLKGSVFDGYYLLGYEFGETSFPLIVNMTMLEAVDSLKDENGKTIYPTDLFKEGKWTWSTFKDYLAKIKAYYSNVAAPDGAYYDYVQAYETDFRYAALGAVHANGGAIYDGGVTADSAETIEAVAYIQELVDEELLTACHLQDDYTPEWLRGGNDFGKGATVFTDCGGWMIGGHSTECAARGESIGIIPWPMPDDATVDSETYRQSTNGGNSVGVLKGVSPEKTELALKAFILYWQTYHKTIAGVDTIADYHAAAALDKLAGYGVDLYNETYGDDLIDCYTYIMGHMSTNYANMMGLWEDYNTHDQWTEILGQSLFKAPGMSSYDVAIKANLTNLTNKTDSIAAVLKTEGVHDNQKPNITKEKAILTAGTADVDWTQYFSAEDAVDGVIEVTADSITVNEGLDLNTPGKYEKAVTAKVSDKSGNEASSNLTVIVYDADNTDAPTAAAKEELPTVALNTETSGINWSDFLESAEDADGVDVKDNVTADLSTLDTTTPGEYDVTLTVTDYVGNTAEITVKVTVVSE